MQPASTATTKKAETLAEFYKRVRSHTEELCEPLEIEDYIPQPVVDVSPPKWNIAHTTWFFEEMVLKKFVPGYQPFDPDFGYLFNSYYNTIGERTARDDRGALSRPTVKRVFEYRKYVDEKMLELVSLPAADAGGTDPASLIILGLHHEQQHQELFLTDLKYTFGLNPLFPAYREDLAAELQTEDGSAAFIEVEGGIYDIGFRGKGFCFDNELALHQVLLGDYEIASKLVTNLEFLKFVNDGGYRDHRLWHSEGWDWVNQNNISAPLHWHRLHEGPGGGFSIAERAAKAGEPDEHSAWYQFTLGGLRKLELNAPVCHISYYEAAAFAEWKGWRLPTEFEWEAASGKFDWGLRWEWTNSAYLPYPGFNKAEGAVGEYNGKFMINQMVLRGASVATPEGHSRPTYRNFFHPHLRWQFTGLRLAR
jgi:ergothioneine biosynthesis protein EgtB